MSIVSELFGFSPRRERLPRIDGAPAGVKWRFVRPRAGAAPVRAQLAREDGELASDQGALSYKAGEHYLVEYSEGDRAPVERKIFEQTYVQRPDGLYDKRTDYVLRYFTLNYPVLVETLEGARRAAPKDWIMVGVSGEMWPMSSEEGRRKYESA